MILSAFCQPADQDIARPPHSRMSSNVLRCGITVLEFLNPRTRPRKPLPPELPRIGLVNSYPLAFRRHASEVKHIDGVGGVVVVVGDPAFDRVDLEEPAERCDVLPGP